MEVPQRFCVRWNSYKTNLQTAFPKLLTSEHFVDVTLACERQYLKCHKIVLSACSVYFEDLLVNNPCQHPIVFMKDIAFWEMKALVEFMYKGEVNVSQEQLDSLLKSAESLQIRGLSGAKKWVNDPEPEVKRKKGGGGGGDDEEGKFLQISTTLDEDENNGLHHLADSMTSPDAHEEVKEEPMLDLDDSVYLDNTDDDSDIKFTPDDSEGYSDSTREPGPSGMSGGAKIFKARRKVSEFMSLDDLDQCVLEEEHPQNYVQSSTDSKPLMVRSGKLNQFLMSKVKPRRNRSSKRNTYKQYTMASMMGALEKIEQGISVYSASIQFGVPRKTLRNWMKKYNILSRFDIKKQLRMQGEVSD